MDLSFSGKYGQLQVFFRFLCWYLFLNENYGNVLYPSGVSWDEEEREMKVGETLWVDEA